MTMLCFRREQMQIIYEYCAGIDIHKKMVVVCLITVNAAGQRVKEIRSFRTTTAGLLELHDWLQTAGCTHVAMESTGVYWRPVWNLLEGAFELLLVNAKPHQSGSGTQNRCA